MSWYHYEPTQTRKAVGGIKAVSRRGRFGTTWWGQRWIDLLEDFDMGGRLDRGKGYARKGQVLSIDVERGCVRAEVLGSRPKPYAVTIRLQAYAAAEWAEAAAALQGHPFIMARLLADALPSELEAVLAREGLALFPQRESDLETDCSCPDWSNPCKHIAAVYYLLAEEFDRDPFLLFRLRGLTRADLLRHLGSAAVPTDAAGPVEPAAPPAPLVPDAHFWTAGSLPNLGEVRTPPVSAALPRRLGGFPFWRAETPFLDALGALYPDAARRGGEVLEDNA